MQRRANHARIVSAMVATSVLCFSFVSTADACKTWLDLDTYPVDTLPSYDGVYIVRVVSVAPLKPLAESWYSPPFTFEATVLRTFKGTKKPGELVQAATGTDEEPHARCPIFLKEGMTYLIGLKGTESPFILPRYSAYVPSSDDVHFKRYVKDVRDYYSTQKSH